MKVEFEDCWKNMVSTYKLQENEDFYKWFNRLYNIRHKWCTGWSRDFFSARILSSQRSELTNHALRFNATKTTSLMYFYKIFKETVERWRKQEIEAEFYCSRTRPTSNLRLTGLLKHASEILHCKLV